MAPDDEPKVKDLLAGASLDSVVDAATQRELERWFQLPSFQEVAETTGDQHPEIAEVRERRARVSAEVDPVLLEMIRVRTEVTPETLLRFEATIDVRVRED